MLVSAQYPSQIWDGLSRNPWRDSRSNEVDPDLHDWNQVVAEMVATQTKLDSVAGATTPITQTLWVDSERTDSYTEDGSIQKPYKTIQAAIAVAIGSTCINVAPGTYNGDVNLGLHVSTVRGSGLGATCFTGNIVASDRAHLLEDFYVTSTGSFTVTSDVVVYNLNLACAVTVTATGFFEARSVLITTGSGVTPLTIDGSGVLFGGFVTTSGDASAIVQTAGTFVLFHSYVHNNSFVRPTVNSTGGVCGVKDTSVINQGFGTTINLDNDGSALATNSVGGVVSAGNVVCGAAHTIVEGLNFVGPFSLTGTNLIYRPASRLANDSTVAGATVKNALETLGHVPDPTALADNEYVLSVTGGVATWVIKT